MLQSHFLVVRSHEYILPLLHLLRSLITLVSSIQRNYYMAFITPSNAMKDLSFKLHGIHVLNVILEYFYLGLLPMCFILALGNRPQRSKLRYTLAFIGVAIITVYMSKSQLLPGTKVGMLTLLCSKFAAFFLAFKGIQNVESSGGKPFSVSDIFTNSIFRNIVISLLATLGLYIIASLITPSDQLFTNSNGALRQFEPWHMITSFIQYVLMAPSYIAVLNVYAIRGLLRPWPAAPCLTCFYCFSLQTCMTFLGVRKAITKSAPILASSLRARTRMKWRWLFLQQRMILMPPTKMLSMFFRRNRRR